MKDFFICSNDNHLFEKDFRLAKFWMENNELKKNAFWSKFENEKEKKII